MADYVAAYDDITTQLEKAIEAYAEAAQAHQKSADARLTASERVQHLQEMQRALANLEEVEPVLAKRAEAVASSIDAAASINAAL